MNLERGCCAQSASAEGSRWGKPGGSRSLQRDWGAQGRRRAKPWAEKQRVLESVEGYRDARRGLRLSLCGRLWTRARLL